MWSDDPRVAGWVRQKDFVWNAPTGQRARKAYSKATVYRKIRKGEYLAKEDPQRPGFMLFAVDERGDLVETTPEQRAALEADDVRQKLDALATSPNAFAREFMAPLLRVVFRSFGALSVADPPKPTEEEFPGGNPRARK